ncbi:hypothetical protein [Candidatus Poriferisocius sp.]|uniref:hypothetical protein n=1 Tax=Candidatus Poriferisocius sp. TaxID=3101276 RepID=UPI003B52E7A9
MEPPPASAEAEQGGADQQADVARPSAIMSATATPGPPEGSGAVGHEGDLWDGVGWPRPPLAGMRVDYPERMGPSSFFLHGIVSIEPPCAYLTNFSAGFGDDSLAIWEGRRLALSLLYPEVRFDEDNQTLWNPELWDDYDDIPIAHGDRVIVSSDPLLEDIGDKEPHELHLFWNACPAHGIASPWGFWTSVEWLCSNRPPEWVWHQGQELERICVEDTRPWNQRDLLEQQGLAPAAEAPAQRLGPGDPPPVAELPPPPLFDMHPYHPDMELELSTLVGIVSIESVPPNYDLEQKCVYLYPTAASAPQSALWGDSWKHTGPDGQPLPVRLDLPYPQVRFDDETWTLWNGDIGPITTGDRVIADPISPPDFHTDGYNTRAKQPHEPQIHPCRKAGASATVLDIQTVEHYCTHDTPARHQNQCEQAMNPQTQIQNHLTPPGGRRHRQ